jgi:two-component system chemotaxis sensor kinase CheA
MDVVRSALQHVGGSIDISSEPGRGSTFRLNVPLTLAIMPVLLVTAGAERYAIPQVDVREVRHITDEQRATTVHDVDGVLIHRLADHLLPLVDLAAALHVESPALPQTGTEPDGGGRGLTMVVVETAGRRFGIVVDGLGDATEVIVKPLTRATRSIRMFGGVAILVDGRPALILDVAELATGAGIAAEREADSGRPEPDVEERPATLLLASHPDLGRIAVEMAVVRRLEEIAESSVERSGPIEVVRYQGGILPLIRVTPLSGQVGDEPAAAGSSAMLQTIICESSIGLVGLVVGHIEDVAGRPATGEQPPCRRGVSTRLVVDDRVTELLDLEALVADAELGLLP